MHLRWASTFFFFPAYINILLEPTLKNYMQLFKEIFLEVHFLLFFLTYLLFNFPKVRNQREKD